MDFYLQILEYTISSKFIDFQFLKKDLLIIFPWIHYHIYQNYLNLFVVVIQFYTFGLLIFTYMV